MLVVIPTLLSSLAANAQLAHRLELHWLANREDAGAVRAADGLGRCRRAEATRRRCPARRRAAAHRRAQRASIPSPPGAPPRFVLLHRPRSWSDTEQRWMGWERKRGKLEMLLRLLATGDASGFLPMAPGLALAERIPYVLTLDSDTGLPPGALRELVAVAAHPLNAPQIDDASRRVVARLRHLPAAHRHALSGAQRALRSSTGCSPASAGSTPTAAAPPTSTRTCSAAAPSPARACSTCAPSMPTLDRRAARRRGAEPRPARRRGGALRAW